MSDDIDSLIYFWKCKGDITRWSQWEERKDVIKETHPHIYDAIQRYFSAEKTLTELLND